MGFHGSAPAVRVYCCESGRPKPAARNLALAIGCVNELASGQDQFQGADRGGLVVCTLLGANAWCRDERRSGNCVFAISGWPKRGEVRSGRQLAFMRRAASQSK